MGSVEFLSDVYTDACRTDRTGRCQADSYQHRAIIGGNLDWKETGEESISESIFESDLYTVTDLRNIFDCIESIQLFSCLLFCEAAGLLSNLFIWRKV